VFLITSPFAPAASMTTQEEFVTKEALTFSREIRRRRPRGVP